MDLDARRTAQRWLDDGEPAIVVCVDEAQGSVPREEGTRMVVGAAHAAGTIGGGHLELKAMQMARELLRHGSHASHRERFALGPSLGQCCGGALTLRFDPLNAQAIARWPDPPALFRLQLYGAGHVGRAIARLLATLDAQVDWIDERDEEFPPELVPGQPWPSHVRKQCVDAVEDEVRHAAPGDFFLVLTHNHDLDLRITQAILERGDFSFLGLIGSKTKRQRFIHRFEQRGIPEAAIARMTCPIGVPGISGKQPEIIAVAVVAQMLQAAQAAAQPASR